MLTFRCTARVIKRFRIYPDDPEQQPTGRLGNWYANLFNVGRRRLVLCVNELSLLPVLVPARQADFPARFGENLSLVLRLLGVPKVIAEEEASHCSEWRFSRTRSRQVLGSMNDFSFSLEFAFRRTDDLLLASAAMADTPCSPLGMESPDRVAFALLGVPEPPLRIIL